MSVKYKYEQVKETFEKEGYILVSKEYSNAHQKLDIICPNGHSYSVKFYSFKNFGNRCSLCSGARKWLTKEMVLEEANKYSCIGEFQRKCSGGYKAAERFGILDKIRTKILLPKVLPQRMPMNIDIVIDRLFVAHEDTVEIKKETYKGISKKAIFIDKIYGEWEASVDDILRGHSHPKRSQDKIKETCQKKYGTDHPLQNKEIREKADLTNLKNLGVKNASSSKEIQEKKKITLLKNYGVEFPSQSNEIKEKTKKTNLEKYGAEYAPQNREVALKGAKSSNITTIKLHWKTNEELICQGGYETKVVDYLNENKANYQWQPQTFKMPNGKTYRPDLFLEDTQTWVEIKGYFRNDAQEKWDWFKTQFPTAELWNKEYLKKIKLLK